MEERTAIWLRSYDFNLRYAGALVEGVSPSAMTTSGGMGLENHAAFTLGHLVIASAMTSKYLDGPYEVKKPWEDLFRRKGPGDPRMPEPDSALYPSKDALLSALEHQHQIVVHLVGQVSDSRWAETAPWRFSSTLPTLADLVHFMCITHESMHLGQLAAWRRSIGLPSALAAL